MIFARVAGKVVGRAMQQVGGEQVAKVTINARSEGCRYIVIGYLTGNDAERVIGADDVIEVEGQARPGYHRGGVRPYGVLHVNVERVLRHEAVATL